MRLLSLLAPIFSGLLANALTINIIENAPTARAPPIESPINTTLDQPSSFGIDRASWTPKFMACYVDTSSRILSASQTTSSAQTVEACSQFCYNYWYFGVEYGSECYCGPSLSSSATKTWLTDCNYVCSGSKDEWCGGFWRISVYTWEQTAKGQELGAIGAPPEGQERVFISADI